MIKKYQRNVTESNANGYISYYALILLIIVDFVFILCSIKGKVCTSDIGINFDLLLLL